ncbi:RING finger protein 37-like [Elysia marginata]|uniref:RING finger protein 37-like n=1 Tax=Elysia marginata TaxID=1093978 RepID=A0AAV4JZH4_9GAST|nr:RING finger protein 37-like [Elysia marginata]
MLINFALDCIGTVVTSDKISRDGHECTNLASIDWQTRKKGFIAEHFIKPPVNITFQFPCNIQIYQIFVTPYVGQQLCSQVEIFSASRPRPLFTHGKQKLKSQKEMMPSQGKPNLFADPATKCKPCSDSFATSAQTSLPLFYQVSKVAVSDYRRICFTNPKLDLNSKNIWYTEDEIQCPYKNTMQHHRRELLAAASHVSIRLVYTRHGSSVAVSNIDIWGLPAISVPVSLKSNIAAKFTDFIKRSQAVSVITDSSDCGRKQAVDFSKSSNGEKIEEEGLTIPEEFFDPLTCEVMSIPMLLPCGKNVDLSTLNRFFDSEANYGRAPRDPFTGVVFSENSKPISNIALKSRIDHFLFKHKNDKVTSSVARTLSSGNSGTGVLGKRDADGKRLVGKISSLVSTSIDGKKTPASMMATHCTPDSSKYFLLDPVSQKESDLKIQVSTETKTPDKPTKSVLTVSSPHASSSSQIESKSHEQKLKDSLNCALASILGSTCSKNEEDSVSLPGTKSLKCSLCKNLQYESAILYNSPCNHTICRECLTSQCHSSPMQTIKCGECGCVCKREDFVRKHHI